MKLKYFTYITSPPSLVISPFLCLEIISSFLRSPVNNISFSGKGSMILRRGQIAFPYVVIAIYVSSNIRLILRQ